MALFSKTNWKSGPVPIIFSSSSESDGGISYFVQLLATVLFPYSPEPVFCTASETLAAAAPPEFSSNENGFSSSTGFSFSISKMCHLRFFFSTSTYTQYNFKFDILMG